MIPITSFFIEMGSNASKASVGPFEEFNMNEIQAIEDENELKRAKQVF